MRRLLAEVLERIKPSKEEIKEVKGIIKEISSQIKIDKARVSLGGSGAKGTWLRDAYDIDLYVRFNYSTYYGKDISKILETALRRNFKVEKLHGSRDYFQVKHDKFTIEIIPILDIRQVSQAKNITDISPFHATYVVKHRKGDEIRLAKAFCKAQGCYGAESYIRGFSGYVLELLVIYYGSFVKLLRNAAKWESKTLIGNKTLIKRLNPSKRLSPLILIDPVDKSRNAAAALSEENYKKFVNASRRFIRNPSKRFFEKEEFNLEELRKKARGGKLFVISVEPLKGKRDVVGSKLLKCLHYLNNKLELENFKVIKCSWYWDRDAIFWFILKKEILPEHKKHYGPPIKNKEGFKSFKEKWKSYRIYKEGNLAYIKLKRKYRKAEDFIEDLLKKDKEISNFVSRIRYETYS